MLGLVEDGVHGRGCEHVVAQHAEVVQAFALGGLQCHCGRRRGGLEADGQKHDLAVGVGAGQREGIVHGIDDAHIGTLGACADQAELPGGGHAQGVAIAGQDHAGALGEFDGHVDAADGQDAHRAAGAVDHLDLRGQQVEHAVARQGMGVASAEFHEAVGAAGLDRIGELLRQMACQRGVAELADVFHAPPSEGPWTLGMSGASWAWWAARSANRARVWAASSGSRRLSA